MNRKHCQLTQTNENAESNSCKRRWRECHLPILNSNVWTTVNHKISVSNRNVWKQLWKMRWMETNMYKLMVRNGNWFNYRFDRSYVSNCFAFDFCVFAFCYFFVYFILLTLSFNDSSVTQQTLIFPAVVRFCVCVCSRRVWGILSKHFMATLKLYFDFLFCFFFLNLVFCFWLRNGIIFYCVEHVVRPFFFDSNLEQKLWQNETKEKWINRTNGFYWFDVDVTPKCDRSKYIYG